MEEKPLSANDIRVLKAMRRDDLLRGYSGYRQPDSIGAGYRTLVSLAERGYILQNKRGHTMAKKGFKLTPASRDLVDQLNAEGEK